MDSTVIRCLAEISHFSSSEFLSAVMLLMCYMVMLMLWRTWREDGLYLYNVLAIVIGNIQVLKLTPSVFSPEPVALGTLIFATSFTASDILTEHKGVDAATKSIKLSFAAQIIFISMMVLTILFPTEGDFKGEAAGAVVNPIQNAMFILFAPSVRILMASLISYYISQMVDIHLFKYLKDRNKRKLLWFRVNVSTMISGLLDNIIFSTLAWVILSPDPVGFSSLLFTYILGTYGARIVISLTSTPVIYLSYTLKK